MIRLENVHLRLGGRPVLKGVSLALDRGDRTVLLGESGVGKSTVLKVILGLLEPDSGQVLLEGVEIAGLSEKELRQKRREMAMVFQGGALFDSLTVGENVGYRLLEQGELSRREIEEVVRTRLSEVGLAGAVDFFPAQLSGGMRKRAAIARALAADPACILFDEPTAGLDPVASCRIGQLIRRCQEEGRGTLVVTHDLECAFRVGWKLMLIEDGRIVFTGDRTALENSAEPAVKRFLAPECSGDAGVGEPT